MVLVQFTHDFHFTPSAEKHRTDARTILYREGMIVEVDDECAMFAIELGAAECLEPDAAENDEAEDGDAA